MSLEVFVVDQTALDAAIDDDEPEEFEVSPAILVESFKAIGALAILYHSPNSKPQGLKG